MSSLTKMTGVSSLRPMLQGVAARAILGLVAVWGLALLAGTIRLEAGAIVGGAGLVSVVVWSSRQIRREDLGRFDLGLLGILFMVASPLAPARVGSSVAGIGLDDLPLLVGAALGAISVLGAEGIRGLFSWLSLPIYGFAIWNGIVVLAHSGLAIEELTRGVGRWVLVAIGFSIALTVSRRPGRGWAVLGGVVLVGLVEALFGLWAYATDWTVESEARAVLIGLERWRDYQLLFGQTPGRITGTLGVSSNFFGGLMLIPALLGAGWFQRTKIRLERLAFGAAATAMIFALVLSYTRASLVALVAGGLLAAGLIRRIPFAALLVVVVTATLLTTPILDRFSEGNDRSALAERSLDLIGDNPLTGLGSGSFVAEQFDESEPRLIATPHNSFLLAAAETGIPGGVIFLVSTALPAAVLLVRVTRRRLDPVLAAVCGGLLAFGVQALSNNLFHIPGVASFYWVAAAAALGVISEHDKQPVELG